MDVTQIKRRKMAGSVLTQELLKKLHPDAYRYKCVAKAGIPIEGDAPRNDLSSGTLKIIKQKLLIDRKHLINISAGQFAEKFEKTMNAMYYELKFL